MSCRNASLIGMMSDGRSRNLGIWNVEDPEPVVQVLAKLAALDGELGLRGQTHLADLVEEQHAGRSQLYLPTGLACCALVNAPRSYPNSSDSSSCSGSAAQFSATNGPLFRADAAWMNRAATSLPVPDSPVSSTVVSGRRHLHPLHSTWRHSAEAPTMLRCVRLLTSSANARGARGRDCARRPGMPSSQRARGRRQAPGLPPARGITVPRHRKRCIADGIQQFFIAERLCQDIHCAGPDGAYRHWDVAVACDLLGSARLASRAGFQFKAAATAASSSSSVNGLIK